ncbi:hypothetical protein ITI46_12325 [Streptomyces oryzae]|uniref:Uncharacterized protein n=1 Tax=Streptomyces oryzae TaxID=1434886 RepID=A0ABS3XAN6_9ACTN|nr:hypothetical protein [Streptomyces oryzae]MBO8192446.1 hypothetical protein [Streptomyces oryzae]
MRIRYVAVMAVIPIALSLSACSSNSGDGGVASADKGKDSAGAAKPGKSGDAREAQLKYAQCMRKNGVDVKDPEPGQPLRVTGSGGPGKNKLEEAAKKCQKYMQDAAPSDADANDSKAHDQMVKFAQCMRKNGVNIPDPNPGEGLKMQVPEGSQAKAKKAQKTCQKYLPGSMQMGPS